ncbi:MAG TPA: hypothetical protein VND93_22010, partial [Myxococcales bacterium]|nr:hypothetical protein [Myxococcales bacterium]
MSGTLRAAASARDALQRGYQLHPLLAAATGATAAGMALTFPLQMLDPLQSGGAPAWSAPFRLFASMTVLCASILWIGSRLGRSPSFSRAGLAVAAVAVLEPWLAVLRVVLDPRPRLGGPVTMADQELAALMVVGHVALFAALVVLAVEVMRRPVGAPAITWGIRVGLWLTLLGMAIDPSRGLPALLNSSGDWRPAHVLAYAAVQLLPLLGWVLSRRRELRVSHQLTLLSVGAVSYAGVMLVLAWQAARGQAFTAPDPLTVAALVVVIAGGASSAASVLAHAREVQHLVHEARTASERRQAMLARAQMAQMVVARARRDALKQR